MDPSIEPAPPAEHKEHDTPTAAYDAARTAAYESMTEIAPEQPVPPEFPSFWEPASHGEPTHPVRGRAVVAWFLAALVGAAAGTGGMYVALRDRINGAPTVKVVSAPVVQPSAQPGNPVAAVAAAVLPSIAQLDVTTADGSHGTGSGVIYSGDGYVVTNNHVIEGADQITVTLSTGEKLPGVLTGTAAPSIDIAVVKVAKRGLPSATFGSTKSLHVGDLAVAIGSPFRLTATVTAGVISALHRNEIPGANETGLTDDLQTDAPINPGNSGGALANSQGEVIGINQAIAGGTGGNVGIGFAIPVDIVRKVADELIKTGSVHLSYLGVRNAQQPTDGQGALIGSVEPGGPADKAGVKAGDLIVKLADQDITSFNDLISFVVQRNVGDKITVVVIRSGERKTLNATLGERPPE